MLKDIISKIKTNGGQAEQIIKSTIGSLFTPKFNSFENAKRGLELEKSKSIDEVLKHRNFVIFFVY
jgi:hypothetical protein